MRGLGRGGVGGLEVQAMVWTHLSRTRPKNRSAHPSKSGLNSTSVVERTQKQNVHLLDP